MLHYTVVMYRYMLPYIVVMYRCMLPYIFVMYRCMLPHIVAKNIQRFAVSVSGNTVHVTARILNITQATKRCFKYIYTYSKYTQYMRVTTPQYSTAISECYTSS